MNKQSRNFESDFKVMPIVIGGFLAVLYDATYVGFGFTQAIASFLSGMLLVSSAELISLGINYYYGEYVNHHKRS